MDIMELIERLSAYQHVEISGEALDMVIHEVYGNPFYVTALFSQAVAQTKMSLSTRNDILELLKAEMTHGVIYLDWKRHFLSYFDEKRKIDIAKTVRKQKADVPIEGQIPDGKMCS